LKTRILLSFRKILDHLQTPEGSNLSSNLIRNNKEIKPGAGGSHLYSYYLGGRDQEDCGSKPAKGNSLKEPM
jgi:hypothetical protein